MKLWYFSFSSFSSTLGGAAFTEELGPIDKRRVVTVGVQTKEVGKGEDSGDLWQFTDSIIEHPSFTSGGSNSA
jgi:hypothetical protein